VASETTASSSPPPAPGRAVEGSLRRALRTHSQRIDAAIAVAVALIAWYILGAFLERLPMPHQIVSSAVDLVTAGSSYSQFGDTLRRMAIGLSGGFLIGASIGVAMGARALADGFFRPWVVLFLAIPEPVMIISCILIIGIGETSLMIALIVSVAPFVATVTNAGMKGIDVRLLEMSEVFGATSRQRWKDVVLPQLVPALFAALRTGFALSWKLVLVLEAVATSDGVGAQMAFAFKRLDSAEMVAWALVFGLFMWLIEVQVFGRVERRLSRWRR
jgi:NitT/TauT family transport system permease protein